MFREGFGFQRGKRRNSSRRPSESELPLSVRRIFYGKIKGLLETERRYIYMVNITAYTVDQVKDPFGILEGKRYEFNLELEIEEEDELYSEQGVSLRVIYSVDGSSERIVKHDLIESSTSRYLEFDLEDDELEEVAAFCKEHVADAGK
jgi:hypothetical protein